MKLVAAAVMLALAAGCGSSQGGAAPTSPGAIAPSLPATRWVPAKPTYVLAAPSVAKAQRGMRETINSLGMATGVSAADVGRELAQVLGVDLLDTAAVAAIGIDVEASVVTFSEALGPTLVAKIATPEALTAFFDRLRTRGLATTSVLVDGTELFTAKLDASLDVSWAIADGWLWLHFTPDFERAMSTLWFSASHSPAKATWGEAWRWAESTAGATSSLLGFIDPRGLLATWVEKQSLAVACAKTFAPVQRIAVGIGVTDRSVRAQLAFEIGDQAAALKAATLPLPEGFATVADGSPIVAQWNLDLLATESYVRPCLQSLGTSFDLSRYGIRAGRAVLQALDPDDKSGAGVVSLDLANKTWLAAQLDQIPRRSLFESKATFGSLAGYHLSVPFVASADYVLQDTLAFAAMGDGVLAKTVGRGGKLVGPVAAIDILPAKMSPDAWNFLLEAVGVGKPERITAMLQRWRDAHLAITVQGTSLVVTATGTHQ